MQVTIKYPNEHGIDASFSMEVFPNGGDEVVNDEAACDLAFAKMQNIDKPRTIPVEIGCRSASAGDVFICKTPWLTVPRYYICAGLGYVQCTQEQARMWLKKPFHETTMLALNKKLLATTLLALFESAA